METIIAIVSGVFLPWIIEHGKKFGVSSKEALGLVAIGCALAYITFDILVPHTLKQNFYTVLAQILTTSFLVYEFFLKAMIQKKNSTEKKTTKPMKS